MLRLVLVACLAALIAPRDAAACSKRHESPFELFNYATRVAEVRVVSTPPRGYGLAELRVLRTLKGSHRSTLQGQETNSSCHVGYRVGRRALVFLGPKGATLGHNEGYLELRADDPLLHAVRAYAAATTPLAQAAVLVDTIVTGPRQPRDEAALELAARPDLLDAVDIPARERLLAALAADPRDQPLYVVLARLGLLFTPPPPAALGNPYAQLATLLATRDELEDDSAAALADRIERGAGATDPLRVRALERCERLHARRLYPVLAYGRGVAEHFWPTLAAACRTGQPFTGW